MKNLFQNLAKLSKLRGVDGPGPVAEICHVCLKKKISTVSSNVGGDPPAQGFQYSVLQTSAPKFRNSWTPKLCGNVQKESPFPNPHLFFE